jgi:hypothetical protein
MSSDAAAVYINAGGQTAGQFGADAYFTNGATYSTTKEIDLSLVSNPPPQALFQTERWNEGALSYAVDGLKPGGKYKVTLYFAEIYFDAPGQRVFDVVVNGLVVSQGMDVVAVAGGPNRAIAASLDAEADASGRIAIDFRPVVSNPKISGIAVEPAGLSTTVLLGVGAVAIMAILGTVYFVLRRRRSAPRAALSGVASRRRRRIRGRR